MQVLEDLGAAIWRGTLIAQHGIYLNSLSTYLLTEHAQLLHARNFV